LPYFEIVIFSNFYGVKLCNHCCYLRITINAIVSPGSQNLELNITRGQLCGHCLTGARSKADRAHHDRSSSKLFSGRKFAPPTLEGGDRTQPLSKYTFSLQVRAIAVPGAKGNSKMWVFVPEEKKLGSWSSSHSQLKTATNLHSGRRSSSCSRDPLYSWTALAPVCISERKRHSGGARGAERRWGRPSVRRWRTHTRRTPPKSSLVLFRQKT
jgi:hypothetical protein